MSGQLLADQLRLPFLDPEPWRVAVISPTGRYARNQVAGMIEAGTPLVGGVALGRGGTTWTACRSTTASAICRRSRTSR